MDEELNNDIESTNVLSKTFFMMFLGLLGTGLMSWYAYSSGLLYDILVNGTWEILLIIEIVVVLLFRFLFKKLSATGVGILFFIYSLINGITLSTIFAIFELSSIIYLFFGSAAAFGVLALIGYKTNANLSSWSTVLFPMLFIGLILSLINLFVGNSTLDLILDWVILFTFFGVTIYDMNRIKDLQVNEGIDQSKLHIYGAMELYLDFINIFIRILSLFGRRKK